MPAAKTILVLAAAAALFGGAARAQTSWDVATNYADSAFHARNIVQFAKDVEAATGGSLKMVVYPGGKPIKHADIKPAVRDGKVPAGEILISLLADEAPVYGVDSIPFLATGYDGARKLYAAQKPFLERQLAKDGLILLFSVPWPPQGIYAKREINSIDDLKGLKFRIGGFAGRVLQKMGAVPQQIAGGDIYPALEKGTIDGAEWVGPYDDEKLGFYKVAPHYYYPGWWEGGPMLLSFVNLDKWNALPKYYQSILEQAGHYANNWMMAKYDQSNPAALRKLLANGTKLHAFSPQIMEASLKAAKELHSEVAATNADFKKVYESLTTFSNNSYQWFQVAEVGYDNFMARHSQS